MSALVAIIGACAAVFGRIRPAGDGHDDETLWPALTQFGLGAIAAAAIWGVLP